MTWGIPSDRVQPLIGDIYISKMEREGPNGSCHRRRLDFSSRRLRIRRTYEKVKLNGKEREEERKKLFQRSYVSLENPWDSRGKFVRQNGLISKNAESITRSTCIPRLTIITITNFRSGLEAQLDRSSSWNIANCNLFPRSLNVSLFQRGNKGSMGKNLYPLVESATESPMCVYIYTG